MNGTPERACLLIADISGYSGYLAGVELDHAQDVLADLLGTVVKALRPNFRLAKLEGDAAFVYAMAEEIDGSLLLDTVERCYFAFRRRLLSIRQSSTCECNACILIPSLDLKLVAHHGVVGRLRVSGRAELVGADIVLAHRLLKNKVGERLGLSAYAFFTDACLAATALDPEALGMQSHGEEYEHVGEVSGWVHDLERAWKLEHERRRVYVGPKDALWSSSILLKAPPELVWAYVTSPRLRPEWQVGVVGVKEESPTTRRGVGTTNHCMHGEGAVVEEILDWRPPGYVTGTGEIPQLLSFMYTHEVKPVEGGTLLEMRVKPRRRKDREAVEGFLPMLEEMVKGSQERLRQVLAEEMERRSAQPEPELPAADEEGRLATAVQGG
ncbi:MAG: DUF2652 domain-containing protein [Actinomycetota bacterium]|nr:DUF2652 domain-containing protein [Actinomycetota bacterium]